MRAAIPGWTCSMLCVALQLQGAQIVAHACSSMHTVRSLLKHAKSSVAGRLSCSACTCSNHALVSSTKSWLNVTSMMLQHSVHTIRAMLHLSTAQGDLLSSVVHML